MVAAGRGAARPRGSHRHGAGRHGGRLPCPSLPGPVARAPLVWGRARSGPRPAGPPPAPLRGAPAAPGPPSRHTRAASAAPSLRAGPGAGPQGTAVSGGRAGAAGTPRDAAPIRAGPGRCRRRPAAGLTERVGGGPGAGSAAGPGRGSALCFSAVSVRWCTSMSPAPALSRRLTPSDCTTVLTHT